MNKIEKAVIFATRAHAGKCRKGKDKPYILHPIEAMAIVKQFTDDEDVLAAAVLHDTVEDTSVTVERLEKEFGPRVAVLVASVSEDKKKERTAESTWKERKQETIDGLKNASRDTKLLCLGDKLSNLREMSEDYADIGDELWERFNQKDKRMHDGITAKSIRFLPPRKNSDGRMKCSSLREHWILSLISRAGPNGKMYFRSLTGTKKGAVNDSGRESLDFRNKGA